MDPSKTNVLVLGAGGMVGQPVARELIDQGFTVRVGGRNTTKLEELFGDEAEVVSVDILDRASIEKALECIDAVHLSLHGPAGAKKNARVEPEGILRLAGIAEKMGVKAISYTSGATVGNEDDTFYVTLGKLQTENQLLESTVPTTIFRPSWFMETLDIMVRGDRGMMPARMPNLLHPVAGRDYGRMIAKAYRDDVGRGIYYVYGPQAMTMADAMGQILAAKAPNGKLARMSPTMLKILKMLLGGTAKYGIELMEHFQFAAEPVHPGQADEIFGRNTTTLQQWLSERYGSQPTQPTNEEPEVEEEKYEDEDDEQVFDLPLRRRS